MYKYKEDGALRELKEYIDSTYGQHYNHNKYQATEFIIDSGHGEGFCIGNIMKYAQRYGKKNGKNRADIMKVIHYAIILLSIHEAENSGRGNHPKTKNNQHAEEAGTVAPRLVGTGTSTRTVGE